MPLQHKLIGFYNRDEKCLQDVLKFLIKFRRQRVNYVCSYSYYKTFVCNAHILKSCIRTVGSGALLAVPLKIPFFWYAPLRHGWMVLNVSRKLSDLTLKERKVLKNVLIFLVTKFSPVVWPNNCISSQESPTDPTASKPFYFRAFNSPWMGKRNVALWPEAYFTKEATGVPFKKCVVNLNLQLVRGAFTF